MYSACTFGVYAYTTSGEEHSQKLDKTTHNPSVVMIEYQAMTGRDGHKNSMLVFRLRSQPVNLNFLQGFSSSER